MASSLLANEHKVKTCRVVDTNATIEWAGFNVELYSIQDCLGGAIFDPSNFYVNLCSTWKELERSQKGLDGFFEQDSVQKNQFGGIRFMPAANDLEYYYPDPEVLKAGMYIVVRAKLGKSTPEWHRARILEVLENNKYRMFLIDYGDECTFPIKDVRYLPSSFLEFPAQGIRCKLDFGTEKSLNKIHSWKNFWKKNDAEIFFQIFRNRKLRVEFLSYEVDMSLPNPIIWLVKLWKYDDSWKVLEDEKDERVDEILLKMLGEKWVTRRKRQIELNKPPTRVTNPEAGAKNTASSSSSSRVLPETDYDIKFLRTFEGREDIINVSEVDFKGLIQQKPVVKEKRTRRASV